jgi:hypothetical protein
MVPSLRGQRRITDFLGHVTARIDKLRSARTAQMEPRPRKFRFTAFRFQRAQSGLGNSGRAEFRAEVFRSGAPASHRKELDRSLPPIARQ